ncbi:MAG: alkane 1-monooxygenase [Alphaproteobacteria bacterium]|nr:alkane 1-monooxygenase [Alphaproteobacteria bacterium]MBL7098257.1 alkane 1-monooxygenase [Alphaproteobacteria bacterium]
MNVLRYIGPFLFALSIPLFHMLSPAAPFLTVALLLLALTGAEAISSRGAVPFASPDTPTFRWLPNLYVPVQLAVIAWAVAVAPHATGTGFAALALSIGVTTGVFGMLAAHELVHGHSKAEHGLGLAMLTGMTYRHFRVAHIFGHHRWAATDRDPATARLGESFYAFLFRTVIGQFTDAWRFETTRITARRRSVLHHRIAGDVAVMAAVYIAIFLLTGWRGVALFAAQGAVGIIVLELFNYVAHYGLARAAKQKGHEPFGDRHSWNSSNVLANTMIFNMGRHSYHHTRPAASYQSLKWVAEAPELPAGYAGSILLALVPPLWRRIMDPAVQRLHTATAGAA